jgi:hypothetical protein
MWSVQYYFFITNEKMNYPSDISLIGLQHYDWKSMLTSLERVKNTTVIGHELRNILRNGRSYPFVNKDKLSFITLNDRVFP